MELLVVNPNTSPAATDRIHKVAAATAGDGVNVVALSAPSGLPLIDTEEKAVSAGAAVARMVAKLQDGYDACVIAAFMDPGLEETRRDCRIPVVGMAEAAMQEAAEGGRRFSILVMSDGLRHALEDLATRYGVRTRLVGIRGAASSMEAVADRPELFLESFVMEGRKSVSEEGAEVLVLGGGPLCGMAELLQPHLSVPVLDGVACAVRRACRQVSRTG